MLAHLKRFFNWCLLMLIYADWYRHPSKTSLLLTEWQIVSMSHYFLEYHPQVIYRLSALLMYQRDTKVTISTFNISLNYFLLQGLSTTSHSRQLTWKMLSLCWSLWPARRRLKSWQLLIILSLCSLRWNTLSTRNASRESGCSQRMKV